ncbi:unnamed protein product [Rangifer tarandus platyrhynchus]|uniref:Uncharacterized protein n=1 Tax=Rangifer tarandus platyrhynchus TaxID=3082113 RepID=A0ABN8ZAM3_RANTA|nr:unnamed protein product [Rangifer tarandus platyrhynchus]CAI9688916.1 unnamed protein product [Rangifer tarandus platyrhynchus]
MRSAERRSAPTLRAGTGRRMRRMGRPHTCSLAPPLPPNRVGSAASAGEAWDCTAFSAQLQAPQGSGRNRATLCFGDLWARQWGQCVSRGRSRGSGFWYRPMKVGVGHRVCTAFRLRLWEPGRSHGRGD